MRGALTGIGLFILLVGSSAPMAKAQPAPTQPVPPWAATPAQCVDHYRRTLVFLRDSAAQAGVNSDLLNSLTREDTVQPPDPNCARPIHLNGAAGLEQREAQAQTELVNRCAIKTSLCIIAAAKAGADCMAASNRCLQTNPIPKAVP